MLLTINNTNQNFNGKIILNGKWTNRLKDGFMSNKEVLKLSSGKKDIVATMSTRKPEKYDINHSSDDILYKLSIKAQSSTPFIGKLKSIFGLSPKTDVTHHYHRESSMARIMNERLNADKYGKKLGLFDLQG